MGRGPFTLINFQYPNDGSDDEVPFAYLNYILFDEWMNFIDAGWKRVSDAAGFDPPESGLPGGHEHLKLDAPITVTQKGYIYIWVSNQSEATRLWFDDLTVKISGSFVTQSTDYGVWGDVLREQKTDESKYRFGYQGQFAEKDEETGWNHFELREYDPVIGRWLQKDPAGQYWSPYVGMGNNPISRTDPDGGFDDFYIHSDGSIEVVKTGPVDNFYYVDANNNITTLAEGWTRNTNGLLQMPENFSFNSNGISFGFSIKEGNHDRAFVDPKAMAAMFGAFVETGYNDFVITQFSFSNGASPSPSVSHVNGRNGDFRYLRTDASGEGTTVFDPEFDVARNSNFTSALHKFGYRDLKSFHLPIPYQRPVQLPETSHLKNHHHHLHLQGFRPNITETRSPRAPVLYIFTPNR